MTSRQQLAPIIARGLGSKDEKLLARQIAAYLLDTSRTGELDSLMRDVVDLRAENGVVEVTAVSAHELTPAATRDIKAKIKSLYPAASEIIVNERIDFEQIGGVRLEFPGKQLDLSVRAKLNKLKRLTTE